MNTHLEQAQYEITTWVRLLDFQQQENIYMKNRIAEVVKSTIAIEALDGLEYFQNLFLNKDAVIALLRRDIVQLSNQLNTNNTPYASLATLRKDMQQMEQEFNTLRTRFNDHMLQMVSS